MSKPEGERIAVLEQIAMDTGKALDEIKSSIKEVKTILETQASYETRLKKLEQTSNLWRWLSPTLSAVVGSVLTFLIINYLQNLK